MRLVLIDAKKVYDALISCLEDEDEPEGSAWARAQKVKTTRKISLIRGGENSPMPDPFHRIALFTELAGEDYLMRVDLSASVFPKKDFVPGVEDELKRISEGAWTWKPCRPHGQGYVVDSDGLPIAGLKFDEIKDQLVYKIRIGGSGLKPRVFRDLDSFRDDSEELSAIASTFVSCALRKYKSEMPPVILSLL